MHTYMCMNAYLDVCACAIQHVCIIILTSLVPSHSPCAYTKQEERRGGESGIFYHVGDVSDNIIMRG